MLSLFYYSQYSGTPQPKKILFYLFLQARPLFGNVLRAFQGLEYLQVPCFFSLVIYYLPVGYSHVKAYRDVLPKWVTFSPKILRHGSNFGQKILRRGSHFTKKCEKIEKLAVFEVEKPLEMGPNLRTF